jgi:hypothetical protein
VRTAARHGGSSSYPVLPLPTGARRREIKRERHEGEDKMDMRKFSGEHFIKVDDVRDGPIQGQIAAVRQGKYDKPDVVFESGDVLSLNATNTQTLIRAYGTDSEHWVGEQIEMFLGKIKYQGSDHEAVLVRPISPPLKPAAEKKPPKADFDDKIPY